MVINIQINKKDVFLFAAILVFIVGAGFVIATNASPDSLINGHTIEQILYVQLYSIPRVSGYYIVCDKVDAAAYCGQRGQIFIDETCISSGGNDVWGYNYASGGWSLDDSNNPQTNQRIDVLKCAWGYNGDL